MSHRSGHGKFLSESRGEREDDVEKLHVVFCRRESRRRKPSETFAIGVEAMWRDVAVYLKVFYAVIIKRIDSLILQTAGE